MAFEAYAVAVRVQLTGASTFAAGLMGISRAFAKVHGDASNLQSKLDRIRLSLAAGAAIGGAGALGVAFLAKSVKPASEYAHQLSVLNLAGMKQIEIAQAIGAAWRTSGDVLTTTATENLKAVLDLRNVLGSMPQATWALPIVSKVGAVMAASSESPIRNNAQDIAFSMAKALDIIGAARDPQTFAREAALMSKVVTAFQNRVTPGQYQGVFQYARQAKFDLSDEFKYEILPSLMLEAAAGANSLGGGSRGVGPMLAAFYRITNQGYINKKSLPLLARLGWINPHTAIKTTTKGTTVGQMVEAELAARNPFEWAQHRVADIRGVYGPNVSDTQLRSIINQAFRGNQLAAAMMVEFASKPQNFRRDQALIRGAMPYDLAYAAAMKNDPEAQMRALRAQWTNVSTQLGLVVLPTVISVARKLTEGLRGLSTEMKRHPGLVKTLTYALGGLSILGVVAGGVAILGAAVALVSVPALAAGAAIIGLGVGIAGLITYAGEAWRELKSFARWVGREFAAGWRAAQQVAQATWSAIQNTGASVLGSVKGLIANVGVAVTGWLSGLIAWIRSHLPSFGLSSRAPAVMRPSPLPSSTPGRSGVVAPLHMQTVSHVTVPVHLDGRKIAEVTAHHLSKAVGYQHALGRHDPTATLAAAGAGYET